MMALLTTAKIHEFGDEALCEVCKGQIIYIASGWTHVYLERNHHVAKPTTEKPTAHVQEIKQFEEWRTTIEHDEDA